MTTETGVATYRRLLTAVKPYWLMFVLGVAGTLILSLVDAGFVRLIKPIINTGLIDRNLNFITWLPMVIMLMFVLRSGAGFCSTYCVARVSRSVVMEFRQRLFAKYLQLPARYYDTTNSGNMLSTVIYNVNQVAGASSDVLISLVRDSSFVIGLLFVMFSLNWKLTLLFVVVAPFIAVVIKISSRRMRSLSVNVQDSMADVVRLTDEAVQAYKVIRVYGGQQSALHKFKQATLKNRHQELKIIVTDSLSSSGVQILLGIPLAIALYFAAQPALQISAGTFAAMITAMITLSRPVKRLTQINSTIQKGIAGAASIFKMMDLSVEPDEGVQSLARADGHIEFRQVSFSYATAEKPVLHNINFKLEPGKTLALVGKSGAGKTTIANLLPRFYQLDQGEILVDGVNIYEYKLVDLRAQFAYVSQDVVLLDDTLANNIAYGCSLDEASPAAIKEAAEAACVSEFASQMSAGLDTLIGEDGVMLSGGQRQRVAIARAFIKQAPLLILDEATSSLDTHSEKNIQRALANLMTSCTTLVIAHRLSTVEHADHILVLDQGAIVEQGKHSELLARQGVYAELYAMQFTDVAEIA